MKNIYVINRHIVKGIGIGVLIIVELLLVGKLLNAIVLRIKTHSNQKSVITPLSKEVYIHGIENSKFPHFFEPKPNFHIVDTTAWLPHNVTYTINADSLNERMDYSMIKADHTFRIVTLGDSFTYGLFVNTSDNYSEQLEVALNARTCANVEHFDVINLGVPSYDIGYSMERFRMRGEKYAPDMVIWFMNQFSMNFLADHKIQLENKYMKETTVEEIRARESVGEFFYPGVRAYRDMVAQVPMGEIIGKEASYLTDFSSLYEGPLIIVTNNWHMWHPLARLAIVKYAMFRPSTWLFLSLPSLDNAGGLLRDGHPNEYGHNIIASSIRGYLLDHELLPCKEPAP